MKIIKFSKVWDKLNESTFTTLRPYTSDKELYYRQSIGKEFTVVVTPKYRTDFSYPTDYKQSVFLVSVEIVNPNNIKTSVLAKDVTFKGQIDKGWLKYLLSMDKVIMLTFSDTVDNASQIPVLSLKDEVVKQ